MIVPQPAAHRGFDFLLKEGGKDYLLEFKTGTQSMRNLRASMLSLVMDLEKRDNEAKVAYAVLVLINPEMSLGSIKDEWTNFHHIIAGPYRRWLDLLIWQEGELSRIVPFGSDCSDPTIPLASISELIKEQFKPQRGRLPQADFNHTVTTLLIKNFFESNHFLKSKDLQIAAGCSYPTLRRILKKLEPWLERDSSRSMRLRSFPDDIWWKLLSNSPAARQTVSFQDVSGQPRSIEGLIKRFRKLASPDVAIGGVTAALHHFPLLDIVGSPRLDLTVHVSPSTGRSSGPSISAEELAAKIDPGLEQTNDPTIPVRLAIHYLRSKESGFSKDDVSGCWLADPVECLYDLHDARLTSQAEQFFNYLKTQKK